MHNRYNISEQAVKANTETFLLEEYRAQLPVCDYNAHPHPSAGNRNKNLHQAIYFKNFAKGITEGTNL